LHHPNAGSLQRTEKQNEPNTNHLSLKKQGISELSYQQYRKAEESQTITDVRMSLYAFQVMNRIDFALVRKKRRENFFYLSKKLDDQNQLKFKNIQEVPFFYPYWPSNGMKHQDFWDENIFCPIFWSECNERQEGFDFEKKLTYGMIPLPIDHRYDIREMKRILNLIRKHGK